MCTVLLPPGGNPVAVNRYIKFICAQIGYQSQWNMQNHKQPVCIIPLLHTGENVILLCIELFHQPTLMQNFPYSLTICLLHYYPRHVSSINMPIFRRKNCIHTASGIFTLCKRLPSTLVESGKLVDEIILYYDARSKKLLLCMFVDGKAMITAFQWHWNDCWWMTNVTHSYFLCIYFYF